MWNDALAISSTARRNGARAASPAVPPLAPDLFGYKMRYAPVNPSDLIPITGAYRHRTTLPSVAGCEGVGVVVEDSTNGRPLLGQRVLPLRGAGTWQRYLDIDPRWLVPVAEDIDDILAARGYINPLTAMLMLTRWPVRGNRCFDRRFIVLRQPAGTVGASHGRAFGQRYYSFAAAHRALTAIWRHPLLEGDRALVEQASQYSDLVFDAVGGELANFLLAVLPQTSTLVSSRVIIR